MSRNTLAISLAIGGLSALAMAGGGCGGGGAGGTGTGGHGATTTSSSSSSTSNTGGTTSSSTSDTGGTGGTGTTTSSSSSTTISSTTSTGVSATPITVDASPTSATLPDLSTAQYYSFTAQKGDRLVIGTIANSSPSSVYTFDPTVIDTAVTLYDSTNTAIAANNDQWPSDSTDSRLYVQIPADGTYSFKVEDCNAYAKAHTKVVCNDSDPTMVSTFDYQVFVAHVSKIAYPESNAGTAQDGTTAKAAAITYALPAGGFTGEYGYYVVDGSFQSTTDTHVFSFTPPADTEVGTNQRARAEFFVQPPGADDGDGSTSNVEIWVTDDAAGQHVVAQVADTKAYTTGDLLPTDHSGPLNFSFPATLGKTYYLFVKSTAATSAPATDSYFIQHFIGSYFAGDAEGEGATGQGTNDTSATAQVLGDQLAQGSFGVDADISAPGSASKPDVDWYKIDVAAGSSTASVSCDAARVGSGLVGFTVSLFDMTGTNQIGATLGPEAAKPTTNFASASAYSVTAGQPIFLKVSAATQDAANTGTSYRCHVVVQ